jgi:hypothetical protein
MGEAETSETAAQARRLIRSADRAALATAMRDAGGWPYASLVLCACDAAGAPLVFLSALAEHTRNLAIDPRISLLYDATAGLEDPLAGARVTVLGTARPCHDRRARGRFLARHPSAEAYADFADFTLYRVHLERAHLVAGFGAIDWIDGGSLLLAAAATEALAEEESVIVAQANADLADAVAALARGVLGLDGEGWTVTGIDPEGVDLRRGGTVARLDFDRPVADPRAAGALIAELAQRGPAGDGR